MKSIVLSAIVISAAALASCEDNGGHDTAQITFYESSINGSAQVFDLYQTVMNSGTIPPCPNLVPVPPPATSNPFLYGCVVPGGTTPTQIAYAVEFTDATTGTVHTVTLNLAGNFAVPGDSLAQGTVAGAAGTVTGATEAFDGASVFKIEGMAVDAALMTDAIAGGNYSTFWRLVASHGGGVNSVDGAFSGSGTFSVYCGANNTGASINLTQAATAIDGFLNGC